MSNNWEQCKLKDVCTILGGNPAPKGNNVFCEDGIPFVRMQDLGRYHLTTNLNTTKDKLNPGYCIENKLRLIRKGSILLPRSGSVALNHRAILGQDSFIVSHICALEIKCKKLLNKFLYYILCQIDMREIMKKTTGLDAITFEDLGNLSISFPSLPEQKRIVEILEKVDNLRRKRQEANEMCNNASQIIFFEMFGDPIVNNRNWQISNIAEVVEDIHPGFAFRPKEGMFDVPQIRPHNISSEGNLVLDGIKYVPDNPGFLKYALQKQDLVFNNTNSPDLVGKSTIFDIDGKYYYSNHISRVRVKPNKLTVEYLHMLLNILWRKRIFKTMATQWVNQAAINKDRFNDIKIPVPPLKEQQQFAELVQKVEKIKEKQQESRQGLDNLFNSIMQRSF